MSKHLLWIQIGLLLLAGLFTFASTRLDIPPLISAGLLCLSVFLFVAGLDMLVNRKMGFFTQQRNFGPREIYTGLPAQLWGLIFIFLGICVLVVSVCNLILKGGMQEFWSIVLGTNWGLGILLTCIGMVVLMMGIIRLMAGSGGYYTGWKDTIDRISGVIPATIGVGLLVLGILLFIFPNLLKDFLDQVINLFK